MRADDERAYPTVRARTGARCGTPTSTAIQTPPARVLRALRLRMPMASSERRPRAYVKARILRDHWASVGASCVVDQPATRGRRGVVRPRGAATAVTSNPCIAIRRAAHRWGDRASPRADARGGSGAIREGNGNARPARRAAAEGARRSEPNCAVSSRPGGMGSSRDSSPSPGDAGCRWCRRPRRGWRRDGLRPQQPRAGG